MLTNSELLERYLTFHDLNEYVTRRALDRVVETCSLIGIPDNTQRAGRMSDAARSVWRFVIDEYSLEDLLEIHEGGTNEMSYLLIRQEDSAIAMRWSRCKSDGRVSRNSTHSQRAILQSGCVQQQGRLFEEDEAEHRIVGENIEVVTATYDIAGSILGGIPRWYISELALKREWPEFSETIKVLGRYPQPVFDADEEYRAPKPAIHRRDDELDRVVRQIRRRTA